MAQHFLLTAKSRTISELEVARMSEDEARETFEKLRWSDTDGKPVCPTLYKGCFLVAGFIGLVMANPLAKDIKLYRQRAENRDFLVGYFAT